VICSICLSHKHVAASCPLRPRFVDKAVAFVFAMTVMASIRFGWVRNLVT